MDITWLGHSCFKITGKQATIITDPYSPDLGYSLDSQTANIVTVSHQHQGHSFTEGIGGSPRLVTRPGEYEIGGVLLIGVATHHDADGGNERGKNNVFVIEVDDISICHLGDLGHTLTSEQVEEIGHVDVLLVPVGGISTIDASTAAKVVRQLEPGMVIPMHYKTNALKWELEPVDKFLNEVGANSITPQSKLSVSRSNLTDSLQVFLLDY
jgi:L-ascorbate metabolism protein UlaG (beta-lactamase superfamily)